MNDNGFIFIEKDVPIWCESKDIIVDIHNDAKELNQFIRDSKKNELQNTFVKLFNESKDSKLNIDFIQNFSDLMKVDVSCLCDQLVKKVNNMNLMFYMGRIFGKGATGIASQICVNGDLQGKTNCPYILKGMANVKLNDYLSIYVNKVYNPIDKSNVWKTTTGDIISVSAGSSGFVNQTCLHLALNNILQTNQNYLYQYDAFYCSNNNNTGYNITELAHYGDCSNYISKVTLDESILLQILREVFTPLFILKHPNYNFIHGDLKPKNVFVALASDGKTPIFKLADLDKSSICWNGCRFFNNTYPYKQKISIMSSDEKMYKFESKLPSKMSNAILQTMTMHNPNAFNSSYDFYTFFYGLMLEPKVYNWCTNNKDSIIYKTFLKMWSPTQLDRVLAALQNAYYTVSLSEKIRLSFIKQSLIENGLELKYDVDFLKTDLKLTIPTGPNTLTPDYRPTLKLSANSKICLGSCETKDGEYYKKCNTNKYSKLGTTYTWDYC